jgi:small subunit ribosomal protein S16
MVKIRLTRIGRTHAPMYRIVAIDSRKKRDGEALEIMGTYNPATKELLQFNDVRISDWIAKGAQVSDTVEKLRRQYKSIAK